MKAISILILMAVAALGAESGNPDIVVLLHSNNENPSIIGPAERQAVSLLARAGVSLEWRSGNAAYRGPAEVIEAILTTPDATFKPGALAYAVLGQQTGTRIEVFYNRIDANRRDAEIVSVLAYVLVHEITHIVEGTKRHSDTGIMKAHWDRSDHQLIRSSSLSFAQDDLRMIHEWVERHNRSMIAGVR